MLEVKNLKKKFGNNLVLKGINLKVEKGDIIAIIGPSGCGKSTFLRCLNGLEEITSGKIIFEGQEINKNSNDLSNLRVLNRREHTYTYIKGNKDVVITCQYCGKELTTSENKSKK